MPRHTPVYSPLQEKELRFKPTIGKTPVQKSQRGVWKWMAFVTFLGLLMVGIQNAYPALTDSDLFQIEQISVVGNRMLPENDVIALSGLSLGGNLFECDLTTATENLAGHPMVQNVLLLRQPPESLVISIRERRPFMLLSTSDGIQGLGRMGDLFTLPEVPLNLPVVTGIEAIADSVREDLMYSLSEFAVTLSTQSPLFWEKISEVRVMSPVSVTVYLSGNGLELRMRLDQADIQAQNFEAYMVTRANQEIELAYIDLRFEDQVVLGKQ